MKVYNAINSSENALADHRGEVLCTSTSLLKYLPIDM
ncbi:hypothetical protein P9Y16_14310 [Bacillus cereus]|nr:hypothetical protein [Bacillus cereus]